MPSITASESFYQAWGLKNFKDKNKNGLIDPREPGYNPKLNKDKNPSIDAKEFIDANKQRTNSILSGKATPPLVKIETVNLLLKVYNLDPAVKKQLEKIKSQAQKEFKKIETSKEQTTVKNEETMPKPKRVQYTSEELMKMTPEEQKKAGWGDWVPPAEKQIAAKKAEEEKKKKEAGKKKTPAQVETEPVKTQSLWAKFKGLVKVYFGRENIPTASQLLLLEAKIEWYDQQIQLKEKCCAYLETEKQKQSRLKELKQFKNERNELVKQYNKLISTYRKKYGIDWLPQTKR